MTIQIVCGRWPPVIRVTNMASALVKPIKIISEKLKKGRCIPHAFHALKILILQELQVLIKYHPN